MGIELAVLFLGILGGVVGGLMLVVKCLTPDRETERISRQSDEASRVALAKHIAKRY